MFIIALALLGVNANAQVAGGQISRQKSQKSTPKSTPRTTHKTPPKTTRRQTPQTTNKNYLSCPDNNHPHMIDLGLPSGTKWACCNVGANKPEDYGGYYAWGETETKSTYIPKTCIHYDGTKETYRNLGSDIAGTQYDVAHVKWGGSWVMPSKEQMKELLENCTYKWTINNGVKGGIFTGKNGCSIFLPATGYYWEGGYCDAGREGSYLSSTQNLSHINIVYGLSFIWNRAYWFENHSRSSGSTVRPVSK